MDHWHYLLALSACLAPTAPLEVFGAGVYRRPRLLLGALWPAAALFLAWDLVAIAAGVWDFDDRYILGVFLPGAIPLEEFLFFLVVPICGLLTFNAVETLLAFRSHRLDRTENATGR
ncbi:lycopene cyclase domain-containing protein [Nocardia sp. NPDC001965]